ncbi:MAG: HAMP domain-containing histidine kinase [Myxococcales bacterium]|nr:HAMP domain-containing histidine kinase [Myxococcales bacterium]
MSNAAPTRFEDRFARFSMLIGAFSSLAILDVVLALGLDPRVVPGVALGAAGCCAGYLIWLRARRYLGVRVFLWSCAISVWIACYGQPSGASPVAGGVSWMLLGVFGALLLRPAEYVAFGIACSFGVVTLVAWVHALGRADDLYPAGVVAMVFVPTAFATLHQISTHFRTTTARLVDAEREAREALETRSRFLATMSHELRTPLNAILGYSELLMDDADETLEDLERIHRSGRLLLGHIDALLDLSKLEAGQATVLVERVDVAGLIAEVRAEQALAIDEQGNTLVVEPAPGQLRTDRLRLRQIVANLLSNANKFTAGGTLTVRARPEGSGWQLEVEDTGVGMTPEELDRVFEAFVQADARTTRRYGGTGLGLVLSRRFAEMMGGAIEVQSTPGEGSHFTLVVPRTPVEAA